MTGLEEQHPIPWLHRGAFDLVDIVFCCVRLLQGIWQHTHFGVIISSAVWSVRVASQELSHISETTWLRLNHLSWGLLIVSFMREDARLLDFCSLFICWMCACETDGGHRADWNWNHSKKFTNLAQSDYDLKCAIITNNQVLSDPERTANYSLIWFCTCSAVKPELSLPRISD